MKIIDEHEWSKVFSKFLKYYVILWFVLNFINFINYKFFILVFNCSIGFFSIKNILFINMFLSSFFLYFSDYFEKLFYIKKGEKIYSLNMAILFFKKELDFFEKSTFLFSNILVFIFMESFFSVFCIYLNNFFGNKITIFIYIALVVWLVYYLLKAFRTLKFSLYKMGFNSAK